MNINQIIKIAVDTHFHIGPEIIPRKYTVGPLIKKEAGNIKSIVLKNHFYPTTSFINSVSQNNKLKLIGSIVLNNSVGGMNPDAIYAQTLLTNNPFIVWFPTIHARNFLENNKFEIPPEWFKNKHQSRLTKNIMPVDVIKNGKLSKDTLEVLKLIKKYNLVLATGHLSWRESVLLIDYALNMGIKKIIITHPIYQSIKMPLNVQKMFAFAGCFIEQSYSMYSIDKIPLDQIIKQIKYVGAASTILSSDVGQAFSPSSSEGLLKFVSKLNRYGFTENEFKRMLSDNPRRLLDI